MFGAWCLVLGAGCRPQTVHGPGSSDVSFFLFSLHAGAMELLVAEMQLQVRGCVCACAALVWVRVGWDTEIGGNSYYFLVGGQ